MAQAQQGVFPHPTERLDWSTAHNEWRFTFGSDKLFVKEGTSRARTFHREHNGSYVEASTNEYITVVGQEANRLLKFQFFGADDVQKKTLDARPA